MLSILLAVGALPLPTGIQTAALGPCAPDKHAACTRTATPLEDHVLPVGKRCHPDPSKAVGCREVLVSRDYRREAPVTAAR